MSSYAYGYGYGLNNIHSFKASNFLTSQSSSNFFYDFRDLSGLGGDTITLNDYGVKDHSNNGRDLALGNTPLIHQRSTDIGVCLFRDTSNSYLDTGVNGNTFLNQDFSINIRVGSADGQPPETWHWLGNRDATNIGLVISVQTTGKLRVSYMTFQWDSTAAVFADGSVANASFDFHFDFTNNTLTINKDGVAVAGSFTSGNISTVDPSTFSMSPNLYIGSLNNNGTPTSNTVLHYIAYVACTKLQDTDKITEIRDYLDNIPTVFELVATITDANALKYPHDVIISSDGTKAYVSGKGDPSLTNVDGSFAIIDISDPASASVLGSYYGGADQNDGETVLELSSTRVIHFVAENAILFNVSNPASPTIVKTVNHTTGGTPDVINGAVKIGNYVFGANKSGYIDVFDVSDIDNFTLLGSYNTTADSLMGPHDVDVTADGEHIVICSRVTGDVTNPQAGCYKVFNNGSFIPIASWTPLWVIDSKVTPNLLSANRIRVLGDTMIIHTLDFTGKQVVTYDISTIGTPVYLDQFLLTTNAYQSSAGLDLYKNRYDIIANDIGVRLLDLLDPSNILQKGGYWNSTAITAGANTNLHDFACFRNAGNNYVILTPQQQTKLFILKINRF